MLEFTLILLTVAGIVFGVLAVKVVPQSEKYVIERLGRFHRVLGPGLNLIFPILDIVRWKGKILERQDPEYTQDAITSDNVILQVTTVVFYRITEPEKSVYRIQNPADAVRTTVTGIVRSQVGQLDLDAVQSNRAELNESIRIALGEVLSGWGIEVTRTEVIDVELDAKTREAMLKQLNAERERRAVVMAAEGEKRSIELEAEAKLYAAQKEAEARRLTADAEAYATETVAEAIAKNGLSAAQYHVALKQVEALTTLGDGEGRQTLILPSSLVDSFGDAFKLFKSHG